MNQRKLIARLMASAIHRIAIKMNAEAGSITQRCKVCGAIATAILKPPPFTNETDRVLFKFLTEFQAAHQHVE